MILARLLFMRPAFLCRRAIVALSPIAVLVARFAAAVFVLRARRAALYLRTAFLQATTNVTDGLNTQGQATIEQVRL